MRILDDLVIVAILIAVFVALIFCSGGCTTIETTATQTPDGARTLNQKVITVAGGKLKEGMMDFSAEATNEAWKVSSGTNSSQAESPNVLQDADGLIKTIAGLLLSVSAPSNQVEKNAEPYTSTSQEILNAVPGSTTD